ncbi:MAG: diaminopimelate epimerase [Pirellulales bacterium]
MKFTKMQGAGNDYVYVDCFANPMPADPAKLATIVADRHYGIGGDGLILVCPSDKADARMRMFNADGSESEMCGNGVRCVAKFVHDHGIAEKTPLKIETGNGVLEIALEVKNGKAERATVDMGQPILQAAKIPVALKGVAADARVVDVPLFDHVSQEPFAGWMQKVGLEPKITCVSMGNPHVMLYVRDVAAVPLEQIGPVLENAAIFPRRINVHFVQIHSQEEVTMRTWERGSGITLACGTGASAVCVSGALTNRHGRHVLAHLPGGDLELRWADNDHVFMTGPAVEVFSGEWPNAV